MNNQKPDFVKKINYGQHMKLVHHFSESTKGLMPDISEQNGITTSHLKVNVEYGVICISTYSNDKNKDYEVSMFVSGDLNSAEKWFLKVLEFNGVRINFPD